MRSEKVELVCRTEITTLLKFRKGFAARPYRGLFLLDRITDRKLRDFDEPEK